MEEETSIGLLIQVSLPLLLFASPPGSKSRMTLGGGTNAAFAPQIDYMTHVFAPVAKKFGVNFDIRVERRGYYPRGGGLVSVEVPSIPVLKCVNLTDMGSVLRIRGMSFVAGALPLKAAHEIADYATRALRRHFPPDVPIDIHRYKEAPRFAVGTGSGITLYAETSTGMTFGGSCLGDRSKRNNVIGEEAAEELTEAFLAKACLDKWAQDQVILFMALARGKSVIRSTSLTLHTKTAIFVAEKFTGMGLLPSSVEVSIEILLDRIDCPGLRLPHKEMTYMRIYLFDVDVRTGQAPPYLPIIFQEQFKFSKKFYAMKDWTELEVMLRFQALNVELLQRQIGGYSKILAEYQGNAWDVLVACNHDPVDSPVTSEGRARLVMKPTVHMPTTIAPECHVRFMVCTIGWTPPWRPYGATVGDKPSKSRRLGDSLPKVSWSSMESLAGRNKSRGSAGMGDQVTRGAIVSAEIDVLKVCCKSMRYRPSGRVYIQVTYLGQAASTVPKLP
ncbi:unnamed protein product, partial [Notodromas monacha]